MNGDEQVPQEGGSPWKKDRIRVMSDGGVLMGWRSRDDGEGGPLCYIQEGKNLFFVRSQFYA